MAAVADQPQIPALDQQRPCHLQTSSGSQSFLVTKFTIIPLDIIRFIIIPLNITKFTIILPNIIRLTIISLNNSIPILTINLFIITIFRLSQAFSSVLLGGIFLVRPVLSISTSSPSSTPAFQISAETFWEHACMKWAIDISARSGALYLTHLFNFHSAHAADPQYHCNWEQFIEVTQLM